MSWFFASSASFLNANSETINNAPINLDAVSSPTKTTHQPEGTTLVLYSISFSMDGTLFYLCYPNQAARDSDYALLLVQVALPVLWKAGSHTAASFTNSIGEEIVNKIINLDVAPTYTKTLSKPFLTSVLLYSICFNNKNKSEYLHYENEAARDADYIVIQTTVAAVSGALPTQSITPTVAAITGSSAGAWVKRNLAVGANKVVQIRFDKFGGSATIVVGIRQVGSTEGTTTQAQATFYKIIKTDSNGDIEIYSNSTGAFFTQTAILSIQ